MGFYFVHSSERELLLGPFSGRPTQYLTICFDRGICRQAVEKGETLMVQDVSEEAKYLSCSPKVRSEIVVPVLREGEIVGELDID